MLLLFLILEALKVLLRPIRTSDFFMSMSGSASIYVCFKICQLRSFPKSNALWLSRIFLWLRASTALDLKSCMNCCSGLIMFNFCCCCSCLACLFNFLVLLRAFFLASSPSPRSSEDFLPSLSPLESFYWTFWLTGVFELLLSGLMSDSGEDLVTFLVVDLMLVFLTDFLTF